MKEVYSIRIDETVKKQLQQISKKENRTVANLIETALKEYIEKWKAEKLK